MKEESLLKKQRHQPWMAQVQRHLIKGQQAKALGILDTVIENNLPLFNEWDPSINEDRRIAWLYRINLLREWGRLSEALAWTCLECEINPTNVAAQALKEQLKQTLRLTDRDSVSKPRRAARPILQFKWEGVAGMREVKTILERDVILPLQEPELYQKYKVSLPNGILFHGPPGCGKTFIARKLAEMLSFNFIEVKPSDLASIYVHGGQEKIRELFQEARDMAPTLLFFDELDALVPSRDGDFVGHHYKAEVNEFLVQLNECWESEILVIGATNLLDGIDPAVRRPGRLDKKVFIGPPDLEARVDLLHLYLEGRPLGKINWLSLAEDTELYTSAELEEVANEAARFALTERRLIEMNDVKHAMAVVKPSLTLEKVQALKDAVS